MAKITATKTHTSGIPLGGIGSGSVELLPDGEFHSWLIANAPRLTQISLEKRSMTARAVQVPFHSGYAQKKTALSPSCASSV